MPRPVGRFFVVCFEKTMPAVCFEYAILYAKIVLLLSFKYNFSHISSNSTNSLWYFELFVNLLKKNENLVWYIDLTLAICCECAVIFAIVISSNDRNAINTYNKCVMRNINFLVCINSIGNWMIAITFQSTIWTPSIYLFNIKRFFVDSYDTNINIVITSLQSHIVLPLVHKYQKSDSELDVRHHIVHNMHSYLAMYSGGNEDSYGVWPRYSGVLIPPSIHNNSHVKTQNERQWYHISVVTAVIYNSFKSPVK